MRTSYSRPSSVTIGLLIALGVLVPTLVASMLVFGLQSPSPTQAQSTSASPPASSASSTVAIGPCAGGIPYSGLGSPAPKHDNTSLAFPILSVPAKGTVEVCVAYAMADKSDPVTVNLTKGLVIGTYGTRVLANGTVEHPFKPAPGIEIAANQTSLQLGGTGPTMTDVAYTVTTNGTRGFYFLNVASLAPEACNNEFRFAVGHSFTASNATGPYFDIPSGFSSCSPSGGQLSSFVYMTKGMTIVPLTCGTVTCDLNETG
jgi:hypothetical protein